MRQVIASLASVALGLPALGALWLVGFDAVARGHDRTDD